MRTKYSPLAGALISWWKKMLWGKGLLQFVRGDDESIEEDTAGVEDEDEKLEAGADFAVKIAKEGDAGRFDAERSYDAFELSIALNAAPLTYQV